MLLHVVNLKWGELLCELLESIVDSHSHSVDIETTLDHDTIDNEWNHEMMSDNEAEEAADTEWNVEGEDEVEALCRKFSLDYMTRTVSFYDDINPKTGKRKRRWETVNHNFQRIPHQTYIARF